MVPWKVIWMSRIAILAGIVALGTMVGCEAAKPGASRASDAKAGAKGSGKSGGLMKWPSLGGGDYATVFGILCMEAKGPDGARIVEDLAAGLRNVPGMDARLVKTDTNSQKSRLFYGAYRGEVNKAADQFVPPAKAREDLNLIRGMERNTRLGVTQPFQLATIVDLPTPDVGPAEWNLKNAPGVYTLQISYCFDKPGLPNHKEVAVAICKALREQGEEAWYLHNDRVSVVTVGHFDETAIEQDAEGKMSYSPAVVALQNKREEFRYNTESLQKVARVIGGQRVFSPSTLIYIREPANDTARARPAASPTADPFGNR